MIGVGLPNFKGLGFGAKISKFTCGPPPCLPKISASVILKTLVLSLDTY